MSGVTGDDLRAIRRFGRKSTRQVSQAVGVSRTTYVNWEADIGQPRINQFIRICVYCGLDIHSWVDYIKSVTPAGPNEKHKPGKRDNKQELVSSRLH